MPTSGEGVRDGEFSGCGVVALIVEILLGVGGFNIDRGVELAIVNADIDAHKGDVGGGSVSGVVDRIVTVELFQESSEGVRPMGPQYEYSSINLSQRLGLSSWESRKSCLRWPMKMLA